ncbi:hypothetical protein [Pedobacter cryoconitis]|uniref:hypothetical protein n=1 Tax=Pedobacter cryoconitis TaxID=188932 RepID=UPI00160B364E|nr:hypothetical protein [Pedobacter cryoconitis]MBB5647112.1 hypothetical protein [Pedobacter cryoconitis]
MKKTLLILAITIASQYSYAQTNIFPGSGNVGIGTLTPQGGLDIYSTTNTTTTPLISLRSNFHVVGNYGMIKFGDYTQTTDYQKGAIIYESVAGSARGKFHIALENTDGNGSVSLSDAKLTILSNGNVGVSVTNPQNMLDVNGVIHSREVKVDLNGWSDYVFKPSYRLPTLKEVQTYIEKNQHLPDMPSEQEVLENGLNLGEMSKLQMKKIEELTLYLIEQNRQISDQHKTIQTQQLQINQLKQQLDIMINGGK